MKNESDTLVFISDHDPNNMDYDNDWDDEGSKEKETDGGREGGIGGFNHKALSPFLPSFQNYFLKLYWQAQVQVKESQSQGPWRLVTKISNNISWVPAPNPKSQICL